MSPNFIPGPVDVAPEVLAAQARPMLLPQSKESDLIFQRVYEKIPLLFSTGAHIYLGSHPGTGMQELAIRNLVTKDVLCCVNGATSERWAEVAVSNGKQADILEAEWGLPITPDALGKALQEKHYEAVCIVHNEASTGVENSIQDMAATIREFSPETLILVDAASSLGGVKIEMDAWNLDFVLASSHHCLALPPGLSLCAVSNRCLRKAELVPNRGWYFDLLRLEKYRTQNTMPATPPLPLIYALDVQLDRMLAEGLENRYARHAALSRRVQTWAVQTGLELFAPETCRSKTVTTLKNSLAWNITELNKFLLLRGMRVANGHQKLKDATFRIATMGEIQMFELENLFQALDAFINK